MRQPSRPFRRADLARRAALEFHLAPDAAARAALAEVLGASEIRRLTFAGRVTPVGSADWELTGRLVAEVVQPCVVTLEPVTTAIDEAVRRLYLAEPGAEPAPGSETEMDPDTDTEPLGAEIDPGLVMAEALALALPDFPRAPGAALDPGLAVAGEPPAHPFAALSALRRPGSD
jgi:uncharacterized metal-binding protein YceD (DUF177 family)